MNKSSQLYGITYDAMYRNTTSIEAASTTQPRLKEMRRSVSYNLASVVPPAPTFVASDDTRVGLADFNRTGWPYYSVNQWRHWP